MRTNVRLFLLLFAITGCSTSERSASAPPAQELGKAPPAAATQAAEPQAPGMSDAAPDVAPSAAVDRDAAAVVPECAQSSLKRSRCMIAAVLQDLKTTYLHTGGGGITELRRVGNDTYAASIAQEERLDIITYALTLDDRGQVVIEKRTESTKSAGR